MSLPPMGSKERYATRPFLRMVDSYVLDCMGCLPAEQNDLAIRLLPKLASTFGADVHTWQELVERQLEFSPQIRHQIRVMWSGFQEAAKQQGMEASSDDFVYRFVSANVGE